MDKSPRPKPKPKMDKSPRPYTRSDAEAAGAVARGNKNAQPDKMAKGGMCRGMGAATKGGRFGKNG
jgi:hypothetical protein